MRDFLVGFIANNANSQMLFFGAIIHNLPVKSSLNAAVNKLVFTRGWIAKGPTVVAGNCLPLPNENENVWAQFSAAMALRLDFKFPILMLKVNWSLKLAQVGPDRLWTLTLNFLGNWEIGGKGEKCLISDLRTNENSNQSLRHFWMSFNPYDWYYVRIFLF